MATTSMKREDPAFMEEKRTLTLAHSEKEANKERWGLFSQRPPLGLGDCIYEKKVYPRDANTGNVVTAPRNFYTGPMKKGKGCEVYFDPSNFINKEKHVDNYKDYTKIHRALKSKQVSIKKDAEGNPVKPDPFLPAVTKWNYYKDMETRVERLGSPYESKPDYPNKKTECMKDSEGNVRIGPPNMLHHPLRGGHYNSCTGHTINKYPEYIAETYDAGRHDDYLKGQVWNKLYNEGGKGYFKSMSNGPNPICVDKSIFGNAPALGPSKNVWNYNGVKHENQWRPSNPHKSGKLGTLDKFQRLIPDPTAIHKATRKDADPNKKDSFFPSGIPHAKPSPSVSLNFVNIRSAIRG